ncbi:MAG: RNA polymerase sigma-70 factor (ECF subfamily) [Bermanella sp.]|jgi:RNA polymerase sigma-70 factor (ECF subfamily)
MSLQDSDKQLVLRVQKGDKRAFDLLVLKHQHKIMSLVSRYVDMGEVPDVTQEAFIKAYRALKNFRGDSQFYTWLYRIAVNTAKNYLVTQGRRPPTQDIDVNDAEHYSVAGALKDIATPESIIARDQLKEVVFEAIDQLPDELRTAIRLRELEGMSYEEIGEVMDCPIGTVRSRIFRARESIDKAMAPLLKNTQSKTAKG